MLGGDKGENKKAVPCSMWALAGSRPQKAAMTATRRPGLLTHFPTVWVHQGNIFRGNQINLNPIFRALRTGLSLIKMFPIHWDRDSQDSVPSMDMAQQPSSLTLPQPPFLCHQS